MMPCGQVLVTSTEKRWFELHMREFFIISSWFCWPRCSVTFDPAAPFLIDFIAGIVFTVHDGTNQNTVMSLPHSALNSPNPSLKPSSGQLLCCMLKQS